MKSLLFITLLAVLFALTVASTVNVKVNVGGSKHIPRPHMMRNNLDEAESVAEFDAAAAPVSRNPGEKPVWEGEQDDEFNAGTLREAFTPFGAARDVNPKCTAERGTCATSCPGGQFKSGLCTGAASVRCCIKPRTPSDPTPPTPSTSSTIDVTKASVNTFLANKIKAVRGIATATYTKHIKGIISQFNRIHSRTPIPKSLEVLAYILGTAEHESARFSTMKEFGGERKWYAPYYGRGYVQLTHRGNYQKYNTKLHTAGLLTSSQNIVSNPNLLLQDSDAMRLCSAFVIVDGMLNGVFTGASVLRYINAKGINYVGARAVVNGSDRASLIAGYARSWATILTQAKNVD
jgi:hypothetical protein